MNNRLIMFFGTECVHCHEMDPLIKQLEREEGIKIEKLEVWHNAKNMELLKRVDTIGCTAIPFFYNEKTGKQICGNCDYKNLKKWAKGE